MERRLKRSFPETKIECTPDGEYREDGLVVYLNVKFPKEARLCLGVASAEGDEEDQQRHGHRLEASR